MEVLKVFLWLRVGGTHFCEGEGGSHFQDKSREVGYHGSFPVFYKRVSNLPPMDSKHLFRSHHFSKLL